MRMPRRDVDLFIALNEVEDDLGPHGQPMSEAMSPFASGSKRKWHYEADGPIADNAAEAIEQAQDAFRKQWPDKSIDSYRWTVKKVDG